MKFTTDRLVDGSSCDGIAMVIKNLDLEQKDIVAEFCCPSRWKELSKESGSKILPCGDGLMCRCIDHNLWDIIVNGDLQEEPAPTGEQSGPSAPPAPKTTKQLAAKRNRERFKSILLLAIPDEYLLKFHNVPDAKSLWEAIKSRFGGNEESKKMQKNVLKYQFENFTTTLNESLDKAYDRFQKFISQLEVYAAPVSKEDINQKFLRSLSSSYGVVYEDEDEEVLPVFGVSTAGGTSQVSSTPCADEVMCSFFAQQTTSPQLENEDLQQIDEDDLEELDLRWQVAMLTVRVKKFIQKTRRNLDFKEKQPVTFDKSKIKRNASTNEPSSQALVAQDGLGGYDWSNDFNEPVNYALIAISSSSSSSSSEKEVQNCSKPCIESFKTLQKNFDSEREKHNRARLEIQGYELVLESLESRILGHEKNELDWGEKYEFQNYKLNQMSAKDKNGLGYGTQLDEMINKSETDSEISISVFEVRLSDEESTPANDRFSKADGYHVVPPPITGNFLTPRADISFAGLDEYAIRKKIIESKTTELKTDTSKSKTSETVDDEDDVSAEKTACTIKTNKTQTVKTRVDKNGQISHKQGIGFKKIKACFVCKSTDHLIKDYDFYDKKRVLTKTGLVNPVRQNEKRAVHTVSTARPISTAKPVSTARPVRPFAPKIAQTAFRPKELKQDVKTSGVNKTTIVGIRAVVSAGKGKMDNALGKSRLVWRPKGNYMDHESKEMDLSCLRNLKIFLQDHAVVDSGCSSHVTGNKAYLSDYKDYNGGFVAFESDHKGGKITGKGTQESSVAGSSGKDKEPTQEYILHHHGPRISIADVIQAAQEKPSENTSKEKDVQDSEDVAENEEQHKLKEAEQALKDDLESMVAQEMAAKAMDDAKASNLPDAEIYDGLATLGYVSEGKLTFWKKNFTPQWKFLIHTILHCISPKSGGWDQFGSPIATALICLSSNRVYNFSKLIFDGMVHNIESNTKFLMYPRFLQIILDITTANNGKYLAPTLTKKLFANMKRGYAKDHVPLLPAMLAGAAADPGEGSAHPAEPNPTPTDPVPSTSQPPIPSTNEPLQQPSPPRQFDRRDTEIPQSTFTHVADEATTTGVRVGTEGATTTTFGLDAGLDSGNIHESPLMSHEAPLHEGHTSRSAEDRLKLKELMDIVPKLVTRIDDLEKELHQTKHTYGKAVLTLVDRVKSLEKTLKRKTKKVVISDSEDEELEDQGRKIQDIDDDPLVSLVRESMKEKATNFVTPTKVSASGEAQESEISPTILEAAKTLSQVASQTINTYKRRISSIDKGKDISTGLDAEAEVNTGSEDFNTGSLRVSTGSGPVSTPSVVQTINVTIPSPIKSQREGKAPMTTEEIQATKRIKAQIQQEEASLVEAMRLQAL
ncbi:hypothetical protein Tco_0057941 [Tanacetum coccineum]